MSKQSVAVWKDVQSINDNAEILIRLDVRKNWTRLSLIRVGEKPSTGLNLTVPNGLTGTFDVFRIGVKKSKRKNRFPFELTSFEINAGVVKGTFNRKKA